MRHFLNCRQARIRALALIWQDILAKVTENTMLLEESTRLKLKLCCIALPLQKYIEVLQRQRAEESARLQRALEVTSPNASIVQQLDPTMKRITTPTQR